MKEESVACIAKLAKPYDVHSHDVFLGLAGHFRVFIQDYALKSQCQTTPTQKDVHFCWTECDDAYCELVRIIFSGPVLCMPDFVLPFELNTDASQ